VLLQILDDGRLTDGQGRTVDFRNAVVIMTSNIGSEQIQRLAGRPGAQMQEIREAALENLRGEFRPEFLNRVDEIVTFHSLTEEQLTEIVELQAGDLRRRLAERRIDLELTDAARAVLVKHGYDPAFGARPLKRTLQREVENPLALKVLSGEIGEGDTVLVDAQDGEISFEVRSAATAGAGV
jgi:ATP-dependent Clp protease ATP-binding subunit ClpB